MRVAPYWAWPITALTGRAIGAWFVGLAVAIGQSAWENDLRRVRGVMVSLITFSLLQFIVLLRYGGEIMWERPSAWLYVLLLSVLLALGSWAVWAGRKARGDEG